MKEVIPADIFKKIQILIVILIYFFTFNPYLFKKATEVNNMRYIEEQPLEINILSTGKADCIIIKLLDKYIIIDTATYNNSKQIYDYLKSNDIKEVEYLILSHNDKDHIGGVKIILDNLKVNNVVQADYEKNTEDYKRYKEALEDNNIKPILLHEEINLEYQDIKVNIYPPLKDKYDKSNDYSIIVSIEYGKYNYLFTGDAEDERMKEFISTNNKKYSVIKMAHHGIYNDMVEGLLKATSPKVAIITGDNYKYPNQKVIKLLEKYKIKVLNTIDGDILIKSDGMNIYYMKGR